MNPHGRVAVQVASVKGLRYCAATLNRSLAHPSGHVIELPPYYRIVTQNSSPPVASPVPTAQQPLTLLIAPGRGFGDGRHETTQLCLLAMGYLLRSRVNPRHMLDFGAGNGILGIAAARAGATVEVVEIDECALHSGLLPTAPARASR